MITVVTREEVTNLQRNGACVIEVLPGSEYKDAHLPGAISIPLRHISQQRMAQYARDFPLIVYCYDNE